MNKTGKLLEPSRKEVMGAWTSVRKRIPNSNVLWRLT